MDYLTKYYKNLSESLQERLNILQQLFEDKKNETSTSVTIPSPAVTTDIGIEPAPKYYEQFPSWPLPQTGQKFNPTRGIYHEGGKPFTISGEEGEYIYYRPELGIRRTRPGFSVRAPEPNTIEYALTSLPPSPYHQGGKPFTVPGKEGEYIYYRPASGPRGKFPGFEIKAPKPPSATSQSNLIAGIAGSLIGDLVVQPAAEKAGVFDAVEKGVITGLSSLPASLQGPATSAIDVSSEVGQWVLDPQGSYNQFLANQAKRSSAPTAQSRKKAEEVYSRREY